MSSSGIPARVTEFIHRHIESVGQLEMLLLLLNNSDRVWSPAQVAKELGIDPDFASVFLDTFARRELVAKNADGNFQFSQTSPEAASVRELDATYRTRRVAVIGAIFSKPEEDLGSFADAFLLKKPEKEEG